MLKQEAESKFPGDESCQKTKQNKNAHQHFREEHYTEKFLCVVWSTQSAKHVKCSACFFSSWDFSVAHSGMYNVEQRVNSKHQINKGKAIGSMLKISHYFLWVVRHTAFWRNSSEDAFHKFLCSAQHRSLCSRSWHLFWHTFPQKWIAKEMRYIYIYTLRTKSNYYA